MLRGNQRVFRLLLLVNLFSLGFTLVPQAANAANEMQISIIGPNADGITDIGICFTNPSELGSNVSFSGTNGSGSFLVHSGTPSCPSFAAISTGQRLTSGQTYNFDATATSGGRIYSASRTYTAPGEDPAVVAARLLRESQDANFRAAQNSAIAVATAESQAWNAANPGKQKCIQWGPIVHANGVSTASGGVCANIVPPGPTTTVQSQDAPTVEGPTTVSTPTPTTQPTPVVATPDANPELANEGSGKPFTRVLPGQLSTSQCPVGYQAANGIIVAIGKGTYTECWPTNAWQAWQLGGSTWEQFKASGGSFNVQAVIDLNNAIASLKSEAKIVAQTAADSTPGIQRCSKWSGYGQNGQECAYTFVAPTAGLPTSGLPTSGLPNAGLPTSGSPTSNSNNSASQTPPVLGQSSDTQTVLSAPSENSNIAPTTNSDSPKVTATIDPTSVQVSQTSSGTSQIGLTTISVEGTTKEIAKLIPKIVAKAAEQKSLATILTKLDAMRAATYSKAQALPNERNIEETAVSLTPEVCSVKGAKVTSLKAGICIFSYELTGASGNTFTVEKQIVFKK